MCAAGYMEKQQGASLFNAPAVFILSARFRTINPDFRNAGIVPFIPFIH